MSVTITFQASTVSEVNEQIFAYASEFQPQTINYAISVTGRDPTPEQVVLNTTAKVEPKVKPGKTAPAADSPQPDAAAESAASSPTTEEETSSGSASPASTDTSQAETVPYEVLRTAVLKLAVGEGPGKGKEAVTAKLAKYGAAGKKASDVDPSRWGDMLAEINALLES